MNNFKKSIYRITTTDDVPTVVEFSAPYTASLNAPLGESDSTILSGNITIIGGYATFSAFAEIFVDAGVGSNFLTDINIDGNLATASTLVVEGVITSGSIVLAPGIYPYTVNLSVEAADGGGGISYTT